MSEKVDDKSSDLEKRLLVDLCNDVQSAIDKGDIECLKKVSALNKDTVNEHFDHEHEGTCMGTTPLMYTCLQYRLSHLQKFVEILKYLISVGADVNMAAYDRTLNDPDDPFNRTTPLIRAINWDDVALVRVLLSCGADVNAWDDGDGFPLMEALWHAPSSVNHVKISELLFLKGVDVDTITNNMTLLQFSIDNRKIFACKMLVKAGADLSVCGEDGVTPLHSAAQWGDVSVVRAIVKAGADINATTGLGQTPLDVYRTAVEERNYHSILEYNSEVLSLLQDKTENETRPVIKSEQNQTNDESARSASTKGSIRSSSQAQMQELTKLQQLASQILGINLLPDSDTEKEHERIKINKSLLKAENFSSKNKLSFMPKHLSLVCERQQSVCKIEWPGGSGTGSLLSRFKILTANHIYEWMLDALKHSPDPIMYRVIFEDKSGFFAFANKEPLSHDKDLDYAILELDVNDDQGHDLGDLIPLGSFISDTLEKNDVVVVVGHPGGRSKKIDFCPVSGLDERYAIHVLFDNPNFPRDDPRKATYHSSVMFHGSSGSAGFDRNGNLVLMHTRGFFPAESQASLIEEGVRLSSIREHARQNLTPEVFNEIFPQREGGFSFGQ